MMQPRIFFSLEIQIFLFLPTYIRSFFLLSVFFSFVDFFENTNVRCVCDGNPARGVVTPPVAADCFFSSKKAAAFLEITDLAAASLLLSFCFFCHPFTATILITTHIIINAAVSIAVTFASLLFTDLFLLLFTYVLDIPVNPPSPSSFGS